MYCFDHYWRDFQLELNTEKMSKSHSSSKSKSSSRSKSESKSSSHTEEMKEENKRKNFKDDCKKILRWEKISGREDFREVILNDGEYRLIEWTVEGQKYYSIPSIIKALDSEKRSKDFVGDKTIKKVANEWKKKSGRSSVQRCEDSSLKELKGVYIGDHMLGHCVKYFAPDKFDWISFYLLSGYKMYYMENYQQRLELEVEMKEREKSLEKLKKEKKSWIIQAKSEGSISSDGMTPNVSPQKMILQPGEKSIKIMSEQGITFITQSANYRKSGSILKYQAVYSSSVDIVGLLKAAGLIGKVGSKTMGINETNIASAYYYLTQVQKPIRIIKDELKEELEDINGHQNVNLESESASSSGSYSDSSTSEEIIQEKRSKKSNGTKKKVKKEKKEVITISSSESSDDSDL